MENILPYHLTSNHQMSEYPNQTRQQQQIYSVQGLHMNMFAAPSL